MHTNWSHTPGIFLLLFHRLKLCMHFLTHIYKESETSTEASCVCIVLHTYKESETLTLELSVGNQKKPYIYYPQVLCFTNIVHTDILSIQCQICSLHARFSKCLKHVMHKHFFYLSYWLNKSSISIVYYLYKHRTQECS